MANSQQYLLDANVFIEAARRYYAFDLAPKFWESLEHHSKIGQIGSIDWVKKELLKGQDDLADWAKRGCFDSGFASTDEAEVTKIYGEIITWVSNQEQFSAAEKAKFARGADGWLIAYAAANKLIVVTHEEPVSVNSAKVKIPNVCTAFQVECKNTFEMLRAIGVRFD